MLASAGGVACPKPQDGRKCWLAASHSAKLAAFHSANLWPLMFLSNAHQDHQRQYDSKAIEFVKICAWKVSSIMQESVGTGANLQWSAGLQCFSTACLQAALLKLTRVCMVGKLSPIVQGSVGTHANV